MIKLNKALSLIILIVLAVSCSKSKDFNFTLNGKIKGLKKGVVYLQKEGDSGVVDLDSLVINGQTEFSLHTQLEEPMLLYLKLFKNDGEEHYIPFFANEGLTEISSTLKNFNYDANIKGSKQQELLDNYLKIMSQFNNQNLDIIKNRFLAQKNNDSLALDSLNMLSNTIVKRKYSYTIQYALNHSDSELAPYLALYEIPSANPIYIDSVYNGLTDNVKNSFYGKKLAKVIADRTFSED